MLISTKGRYALRILVDMAEHLSDDYVPLKEVAKRQNISKKYLEILVKEMVAGKLVVGASGKGGGYKLCRAPKDYSVGEILRLTEGSLSPVSCHGFDDEPCANAAECPTFPLWDKLNTMIQNYLDSVSLADLLYNSESEASKTADPPPHVQR